MTPKISGVVVATAAAQQVARPWVDLLGARALAKTVEPALAARRTSYAVGDGSVEVLEPLGDGPVARAVEARGSHLFSALLDVQDPARLARDEYQEHATAVGDGEQLLSWDRGPLEGLRVLARPHRDRRVVGRLSQWYETTWLVHEPTSSVDALAQWLELDTSSFVPNDDERWGYRGTLTLFRAGQLPRFEVVRTVDPNKPMSRFFERFGPSLYMAFAESPDMDGIAGADVDGSALAVESDDDGPHTIFALPKHLGGVMLGISREEYAWNWSRGRVVA